MLYGYWLSTKELVVRGPGGAIIFGICSEILLMVLLLRRPLNFDLNYTWEFRCVPLFPSNFKLKRTVFNVVSSFEYQS